MSQSLTPEQMESIREAIFSGQKIEAIKQYRDATRTGLAESKEFIEQLTDEMRRVAPERFAPQQSGAGCLTAAGLLLAPLLLGLCRWC